jgi:hypothetical protein
MGILDLEQERTRASSHNVHPTPHHTTYTVAWPESNDGDGQTMHPLRVRYLARVLASSLMGPLARFARSKMS